MKKLLVVVLVAILGVVLYVAIDQHQTSEREKHEHDAQTLQQCWENAAANDGACSDVCKNLANELNK